MTVLVEDPQMQLQANANSRAQFVDSPDLADAVTDAVVGQQDTQARLVEYLFQRQDTRADFIRLAGELVDENLWLERHASGDDAFDQRSPQPQLR